jgi:signal transduction histidine kinase
MQKQKKLPEDEFTPTVNMATMLENNYIKIIIEDNGSGIPPALLQKIFQPFFTTKPAGEGTGLGLSLSYDIITKGHKGMLDVSPSETGGASFTIQLPVL